MEFTRGVSLSYLDSLHGESGLSSIAAARHARVLRSIRAADAFVRRSSAVFRALKCGEYAASLLVRGFTGGERNDTIDE